MPHRILITGGAGFIGSKVALRLAAEGWDVRVLDNFVPQVHGPEPERSRVFRELSRAVDLVRGDVRDPAAWSRALQGRSHVLHLAAETGTAQSGYSAGHYCAVNVVGTGNLIDTLFRERIALAALVVASSRAIYGEGRAICPEHGPVYPSQRKRMDLAAGCFEPRCPQCNIPASPAATPEDAPPAPSSVYAVTKLAQEQLVLGACRTLGLKGAALRYQNVYGPGQSMRNPYAGILPLFAGAIMTGDRLHIFEDGFQTRDFVNIADVVAATCRAVSSPPDEPTPINIGSGTSMSLHDVLGEIERALGRTADARLMGGYREGDIRHNVALLDRARDLLGFAPQVPFRRGLAEFIEWSREECDGAAGFSIRYATSVDEMRRNNIIQ